MSDVEKQDRIWLFWAVFGHATSLALHLGRPTREPVPKHLPPIVPPLGTGEPWITMFTVQRELQIIGATILKVVYVLLRQFDLDAKPHAKQLLRSTSDS